MQEKRYWIENGVGDGGGGSNSASNAKKIFKNKDLTEAQWKQLEKMIEKILDDCMGGNLYNALTNSGNKFQLTLDLGANTSGYTPGANGGIRLSSLDNSGSLFHEMIHAYQYNGQSDTEWNSFAANREVEAYLAQHMYEGKLNEKLTFSREIKYLFDTHLTKNGTLKDPSTEVLFNVEFRDIANHIKIVYENSEPPRPTSYDKNRTGMEGISRIQQLAKNC